MDTIPPPFTLPDRDAKAVISFLRTKYPEFQNYRFVLHILRKQPYNGFDGFKFALTDPNGILYEKQVRMNSYSWNTFIQEIERVAEMINMEIWTERSQNLMDKLETLL